VPTLVLLHGIPDTGRAWDGVVRALGGAYRCVAPDLPGFGAASQPARPRDLADVRGLTDELLAAHDPPERVVLVVHDVGGLFGLAWAVAHPERLAALVILNTSVFPDRRWHWGARILRTPVAGEAALRWMPRSAFRRQLRRAAAGHLDHADIDRTYDAFGPAARATALHLYRRQGPGLLAGLPEQVRALTARVATLVLWGERDPYLPAAYAGRFGAATVRRHPDLGHWPHREAPARIAAELDAFLAAQGLRAV
jgi:pimeloyl-ACP methyl ester carboxylesterase